MRNTQQFSVKTLVVIGLSVALGAPEAVAAGRAAATDAAVVAPAAPPAETRISPPENYCLGGIEDRKIIVDESQVDDPFRYTTRLGCEVDGGDPQTMPDLPRPSVERTVPA